MTATVLSNADRGKKKVIWLGTYLLRLSPAEEHLSVRGQWACKVSLFHLTVASQLLPFLLLVLSVWLWLGCFVTRGSRYWRGFVSCQIWHDRSCLEQSSIGDQNLETIFHNLCYPCWSLSINELSFMLSHLTSSGSSHQAQGIAGDRISCLPRISSWRCRWESESWFCCFWFIVGDPFRATTTIWELEISAEGPIWRLQGYNCNLGTWDFFGGRPVRRW